MIEDGEGNDITKGDLMENKRNYEILVPGERRGSEKRDGSLNEHDIKNLLEVED